MTPTTRAQRSDLILAAMVLLLTIALALLWSHAKLLWQDEFLSFYTDSAPSALAVFRIQLHYPISLDPPTYHLLSHFAMRLLGVNATALRLPALLGFVLMQCALFILVRRIAGPRAAILAMSLPLLTASFRYSAEGRPYGLLLGLYAVAFASWFFAAQNTRRTLSLITLTLSIALSITSHYFGLLILIPIVTAELFRTRERRQLDLPMLAAITIGAATLALDLPFKSALGPYQAHYYITSVSIHAVTQGYRELFVAYTGWPLALQRLTAALLLASVVILALFAARRFRTRPTAEPASLWAGLAAFALLPFFAFLLGRFVTHTMEVRYVIAALIPFVVLIAVLAAPALDRSPAKFYATLAVVLLAAAAINLHRIHSVRAASNEILASLATPAVLAAQDPTNPIYIQSLSRFYLVNYYAPDPTIRARATLLWEYAFEVDLTGHNTNAVTAVNMLHFTHLPIQHMCSALNTSPHPLLVDYPSDPWVWINRALTIDGLGTRDLGPAFDGRLITTANPSHCQMQTVGTVTPAKK